MDGFDRGRLNLESHHCAFARSQGNIVIVSIGCPVDGYLRHLSPLVVINHKDEVYSTCESCPRRVGKLELEDGRFARRHTGEYRLVAVYMRCLNLYCSIRDDMSSGLIVLGTLFAFIVATRLAVHLADNEAAFLIRILIDSHFVEVVGNRVAKVDGVGVAVL